MTNAEKRATIERQMIQQGVAASKSVANMMLASGFDPMTFAAGLAAAYEQSDPLLAAQLRGVLTRVGADPHAKPEPVGASIIAGVRPYIGR